MRDVRFLHLTLSKHWVIASLPSQLQFALLIKIPPNSYSPRQDLHRRICTSHSPSYPTSKGSLVSSWYRYCFLLLLLLSTISHLLLLTRAIFNYREFLLHFFSSISQRKTPSEEVWQKILLKKQYKQRTTNKRTHTQEVVILSMSRPPGRRKGRLNLIFACRRHTRARELMDILRSAFI